MPTPQRVEDGFRWRVSSYTANTGGNCVEVGPESSGARIAVRDSKNRGSGYFTVSSATWTAFVREVAR